jgi:hypothetical protein
VVVGSNPGEKPELGRFPCLKFFKTGVPQYKYLIMADNNTETSPEESSESITCKDIVIIIWVIFTILILCGAGIGLAVAGVDYIKTAFASPNWNTTTGEIMAAYVDKSGSENTGFSYTAKVEYSYVVNDWRYESERIGFGEPVQASPEKAAEIIAPYEVGQPVTVYYDPDDVTYAVIEPGPTFNIIWLCAAGLFFFLFALAIVIAVFRS